MSFSQFNAQLHPQLDFLLKLCHAWSLVKAFAFLLSPQIDSYPPFPMGRNETQSCVDDFSVVVASLGRILIRSFKSFMTKICNFESRVTTNTVEASSRHIVDFNYFFPRKYLHKILHINFPISSPPSASRSFPFRKTHSTFKQGIGWWNLFVWVRKKHKNRAMLLLEYGTSLLYRWSINSVLMNHIDIYFSESWLSYSSFCLLLFHSDFLCFERGNNETFMSQFEYVSIEAFTYCSEARIADFNYSIINLRSERKSQKCARLTSTCCLFSGRCSRPSAGKRFL